MSLFTLTIQSLLGPSKQSLLLRHLGRCRNRHHGRGRMPIAKTPKPLQKPPHAANYCVPRILLRELWSTTKDSDGGSRDRGPCTMLSPKSPALPKQARPPPPPHPPVPSKNPNNTKRHNFNPPTCSAPSAPPSEFAGAAVPLHGPEKKAWSEAPESRGCD